MCTPCLNVLFKVLKPPLLAWLYFWSYVNAHRDSAKRNTNPVVSLVLENWAGALGTDKEVIQDGQGIWAALGQRIVLFHEGEGKTQKDENLS